MLSRLLRGHGARNEHIEAIHIALRRAGGTAPPDIDLPRTVGELAATYRLAHESHAAFRAA